MKVIDVSHVLEPGMPSYPGLPQPRFSVFSAHDAPVKHTTLAPGTTFQIAALELCGNTGTYVDAPFHRHPTMADLAGIPLEKLANVPGVHIEVPGDGPIEVQHLGGADVTNKAVLLQTGWSQRWGGDYFRSGPFLTKATCEHLVRQGAVLVGVDCANVDDMKDPERPAHTILLGGGIVIVEHLRGLDQLSGKSFRFFAVPPAIRGGTSFPVRAFALCD